DFRYWRDSSDLIPPWPDPGPLPPDRYAYPERFWKWGNTNAVATYVIEKPQTGACRALLDGGFDLMETPLLECAVGRGRILFCQVDVTSRWGTNPVATRLAENLLSYLAAAPEPRPDAPAPLLPGAKEVLWDTRTADRGVPPEGPMGWGISRADLFFRETLVLPAPKSAPEGGYIATLEGGRVACGLNPEALPDARLRVKARRILAALRINTGGSDQDGPALSNHGNDDVLYPVKWPDWDPYRNWRW
ncbi:MAG: hypothetical protein QHJ73_09190, partial [Armatimonadota bacterium]|nr:hypothetical protein [Armatimonadota bacterium]